MGVSPVKVSSKLIPLLLVFLILLMSVPLSSCSAFPPFFTKCSHSGSITLSRLVFENDFAEDPNNPPYDLLEGGCTDGTYVYLVGQRNSKVQEGGIWKSVAGEDSSKIIKLKMSDWTIEQTSSAFAGKYNLNHANSLAYNPKENILAVASYKQYASQYDGHGWSSVTFVNPDTLEAVGTKVLGEQVTSVAFHEQTGEYIAELADSYNFVVYDTDFNKLRSYTKGIDTDYIKQSLVCDGDYFYSIQSRHTETEQTGNLLVQYKWEDGEHVRTLYLDSQNEAENIFHFGGQFYIGFNVGESGLANSIQVYEAAIPALR